MMDRIQGGGARYILYNLHVIGRLISLTLTHSALPSSVCSCRIERVGDIGRGGVGLKPTDAAGHS